MSPVTMWAPSTVRFWKDKRRKGRVWHHGGHGFLVVCAVGFHSFIDSGLRFYHGSALHQSGPDVEFSSGNHKLGTLCCTNLLTSKATWLYWFGHLGQVGLPHLSQAELLSVSPLSHSAVSLRPSGTTCFFPQSRVLFPPVTGLMCLNVSDMSENTSLQKYYIKRLRMKGCQW